GELFNFDELICADVRKVLPSSARRPPNFQISDFRGLAQPYVLLKRRSTKRPSAAYGSVDRTRRLAPILHGQMNACSDCRAVRLYADQSHRDPVVAVSRILKHAKRMRVAGSGAADRDKNV